MEQKKDTYILNIETDKVHLHAEQRQINNPSVLR